jgi:hypothetical protein
MKSLQVSERVVELINECRQYFPYNWYKHNNKVGEPISVIFYLNPYTYLNNKHWFARYYGSKAGMSGKTPEEAVYNLLQTIKEDIRL